MSTHSLQRHGLASLLLFVGLLAACGGSTATVEHLDGSDEGASESIETGEPIAEPGTGTTEELGSVEGEVAAGAAYASCSGFSDALYCGRNFISVGDSNTLYRCVKGVLYVEKQCSYGCQATGTGMNDYCKAAPANVGGTYVGSCAGMNDADYCGKNMISLGSPSNLYRCVGGSLYLKETCANGCVKTGLGYQDYCSAAPAPTPQAPIVSTGKITIAGSTKGLLFQNTSTRSDGASWDGRDWDTGYGKGNCAAGETVVGVSQSPSTRMGRRVACRWGGKEKFTGTGLATLRVGTGDQRRASRNGDWAYGHTKLECGEQEYVGGMSEGVMATHSNNHFHAVRCYRGSGLTNTCRVQRATFTGDSRAANTGDWDVGNMKVECGLTEYTAGVSVKDGTVTRLLCCKRE